MATGILLEGMPALTNEAKIEALIVAVAGIIRALPGAPDFKFSCACPDGTRPLVELVGYAPRTVEGGHDEIPR